MPADVKPHILIVDDEAPARELYSLFLKAKGFDVTTAANQNEAMALLQQHHFDVAIIDLSLKEFYGMNLVKPIKETYPNISIIIYTGKPISDALLMDALNRGACALLSKTQSLLQLVDVVKKNLPASMEATAGPVTSTSSIPVPIIVPRIKPAPAPSVEKPSAGKETSTS
jgi:DNA-binding NtrC family response regulator